MLSIWKRVVDVRTHFCIEINRQIALIIDEPSTWFSNCNNPVGKRSRKTMNVWVVYARPKKHRVKNLDEIRTCDLSLPSIMYLALTMAPSRYWFLLLSVPGSERFGMCLISSWHNDETHCGGDAEPWSLLSLYFLDDASADMEQQNKLFVSGSHRPLASRAKVLGTSQ